MRAHAAEALMPPMLHIALRKLMHSTAQNMISCQLRIDPLQAEHVLKLIAKTVCAADLRKSAARQEARRPGLIQQPAVHQHVQPCVGRLDLNAAKALLPQPLDPRKLTLRFLHGKACNAFLNLRLRFSTGKHNGKNALRIGFKLCKHSQRQANAAASARQKGFIAHGFRRRNGSGSQKGILIGAQACRIGRVQKLDTVPPAHIRITVLHASGAEAIGSFFLKLRILEHGNAYAP